MLGLFVMTLPFAIAIALSTVALVRSKPGGPEIATGESQDGSAAQQYHWPKMPS